jgi:hypothetical protein
MTTELRKQDARDNQLRTSVALRIATSLENLSLIGEVQLQILFELMHSKISSDIIIYIVS